MNIPTTSSIYPYLYRGIVKDNQDPMNLGRCRIHISDIYGKYDYDKELLPWARPITGQGVKIPDLEEIVWVMFEDGNRQSPVYIIGVLTTKNPLKSNTTDIIYQYGDHKICYDKENKEFSITNGKSIVDLKSDTINLRSESLSINGVTIGTGGGSGDIGIWRYTVIKDVDVK